MCGGQKVYRNLCTFLLVCCKHKTPLKKIVFKKQTNLLLLRGDNDTIINFYKCYKNNIIPIDFASLS